MTPVSPQIFTIPNITPRNSHFTKSQITIDNLSEWHSIKPEEEGIGDYFRDKTLPMVDIAQLLNSSINLEKSEFVGEPPLKFTFQSAVKVVVDVINRNAQLAENGDTLPIFCPGMGGDLLRVLGNIKTQRSDLIPSPPQYDRPICSAEPSSPQYWLGAILQMLYEQKHLSAYGRHGGKYWVSL